ncbi:MAG: hypothetical protein ACE5JA_00750 [bacterium]
MKVLLEAKCEVCGEKQFINPEELTSEDPGERMESVKCPECENNLTDSDHLRALGGFLSAVGHKRKHVTAAFHAAKILMSVLEKQYPWKLRICVITTKASLRERPHEPASAARAEADCR